VENLIASRLGGSAPLFGAAVVSGLAGLIVTWIVAAIAGPATYAEFAVFWALLFFMVSVLFGVQQETARGVAAVEHTAVASDADTTASPWRRLLLASGAVALVVLAVLGALAPWTLGPSWVVWSVPILVAVPCYVFVAGIQGAMAGTERWLDLALLLTVDAVLRLVFTLVALWIGGGPAALAWATVLPIPLTVAIGVLRGGRRLRLVRVDTPRDGAFYWNTARAVFAGIGAAFFVAGFPAVLALFAGSTPPAQFATLVLVITLTRAPLLMPLSAIQSLLVVRFTRIEPAKHLRTELILLGIVAGVGLLGAVLGALIGPPLLSAVFGSAYRVEAGTVFALVIAATAIAWLYVTGPATLARHLHTAYSVGWAVAAVVAIACLALPWPLEIKATLSLVVGPLCGAVIHVVAQVRSLRRTGGEPSRGAGETQPTADEQEERR
jgi:O-antigen/teichoic acid export membrane protein